MLVFGGVDEDTAADRGVWLLLGWGAPPVVGLLAGVLVPVVGTGGVVLVAWEVTPGPMVASVTWVVVCEVLAVAREVTGTWVTGLVEGVPLIVTRKVVAGVFAICVARLSEEEVEVTP